jgi:glycosyltransferase XagB
VYNVRNVTQGGISSGKYGDFSFAPHKFRALDYSVSTVNIEASKNTWLYPPVFSEILRINRTVAPEILSLAMDKAQQWQVPLGNVLIAGGNQPCHSIYNDYSQSLQLPLLDISTLDKTPEITTEQQLDYLLQNQLVHLQEDPSPLYASASLDLPQDPKTRRQSFQLGRLGAVVTARDHRAFFLDRYGQTLCARATIKLAKWAPEFSARVRMSQVQVLTLLLGLALFSAFAVYWLNGAFITANVIFLLWFSSLIAVRAAALAYAPFHERTHIHKGAAPPQDADLPIYTILVPLYRESSVLVQLTNALKALEYPAAKLDIKLLFEDDDQTTIEAAKALDLPDNFEIVIVPHSLPKTKPKALNLGLQFTRGEYVAVYDAEDIPHPGQLLEALAAFERGPDTLACIQARLNFYNPNDNWLTRQFTVEYSILFDLMLPFFKKINVPIPLGGTSNHFKTGILRKIGAWDPHNVTEDADLGIRLNRLGFTSDVIRSTTREEAVGDMWAWIKQRSRWLKGWMQTYLVHMRHPIQLYKELGSRGFFGFQIVFGGILIAALLHPFFILWTGYTLLQQITGSTGSWASYPVLQFTNFFIFFSGYFFSMLAGAYALEKRGYHALIGTVFSMPLYWLLVSIGAYYGLWQLIFKPFYWEKTNHGRTLSSQMGRSTT